MKEESKLKLKLILAWCSLLTIVMATLLVITISICGLKVKVIDPNTQVVYFELRLKGVVE